LFGEKDAHTSWGLRHSSYDVRSTMRPSQTASRSDKFEEAPSRKPAARESTRFCSNSASLRRAGPALVNGDAAILPAPGLKNIGGAVR
jgi:hypothetical protein